MKIVSIHQPNFFPWLGYFDKIRRADVFILLDDAQFQKTGGTWANRVKVMINGEGRWLTAPIHRSFHGTRKVNEMVFSGKDDWRGRVLKTLEATYRRALYFDEAFSIIEPLVQNSEDNVAEYNIHAIKTLVGVLGYPVHSFLRSSDFPTESSATERLIELTKSAGGQSYLCGDGSSGYQEDEAFQKENIKLRHQDFLHPVYPQFYNQDFIAGLSIIDALMHRGLDLVRHLMKPNEE